MEKNAGPVVFIVDANSRYREKIATCLISSRINNFQMFSDGEQCIVESHTSPDFVILEHDYGKRSWSGIEFMNEFKRIHQHTEFLFLSLNTNLKLAVDAIRQGANYHLIKSKEGIVRTVERISSLIFQEL